ncbi:MAG: ATP-binding protein [Gemmatimonadota bacterium]
MSKSEVSPFTPGQPAPVELFTGRASQVESLSDLARAAAQGKFKVAFLTGERGIGKSSIAAFVRRLAEQRLHLLTLQVFLGGSSNETEAVRRILDRLAKSGVGASWFEKIKSLFGNQIEEVGLFGVQVGFAPDSAKLQKLTDGFDIALRTLVRRLEGERDGLFIVLDDINGLASSESFAHWLKSLVDGIATSGEPLPLFLLLVGLEDRRRELLSAQPSLARVFELVAIDPWDDDEASAFLKKAFDSVGISIEDRALEVLTRYTGGLPVLAHEIGDAAYRFDDDSVIDSDDAYQAVLAAADVVGRKHVEPHVMEAIRSKRYRTILKKIPAKGLGREFKRSDLLDHLETEEVKVADNFLRKMRDLSVLEQMPSEGAGWYRFTSELHFLYFLVESIRSQLTQSE